MRRIELALLIILGFILYKIHFIDSTLIVISNEYHRANNQLDFMQRYIIPEGVDY